MTNMDPISPTKGSPDGFSLLPCPEPHPESTDAVRLVVFDFDQTLSVFHVFKSLAGWSSDALPGGLRVKPFATTELGQVARILELNETEEFRAVGGFSQHSFGGANRVDNIRKLLEDVRGSGAVVVVCTKGLVGAVRKILSDLDLMEHFAQVYGNIGAGYGETPYDRLVADGNPAGDQAKQFLGSQETAGWGQKASLIAKLQAHWGLTSEQAVLVEDDPEEIRRAKPVCRTLFVPEAAGITEEHYSSLRDMVGVDRAGGAVPASLRERELCPPSRRCSMM